MAKARKPIPLDRVQIGDVFLMPLADGRFGVCRVLQRHQDPPAVFVAASPWVGTDPPDLAEPQLQAILYLTHHSWSGQRDLFQVYDPVPETFRPLGLLPPTQETFDPEAVGSAGWEHFPIQVLMQWRWDH